ncbi:hypothetical protein SHIRM173S_08455 [Streptomyces hirsutus]
MEGEGQQQATTGGRLHMAAGHRRHQPPAGRGRPGARARITR